MKKLPTIFFYALLAPVMTLSAGSALAQQTSGQDAAREQQGTQATRDGARPAAGTAQREQSAQRGAQSDTQSAAAHRNMSEQSRMQHRGYMASAPANAIHVSNLIGADVSTASDEEVGPVSDLIIDENGQIVAIVVGVGGFLGMGEKSVAIGWDDVTRSGDGDELELRIDLTREDLTSAPEFEAQE